MAEGRRATREVVFETVAGFFHVPRSGLTDATTAQDIAGWDSVTNIPVMLEIEEALGVEFPLERIGSLATLGDLVALAEELAP